VPSSLSSTRLVGASLGNSFLHFRNLEELNEILIDVEVGAWSRDGKSECSTAISGLNHPGTSFWEIRGWMSSEIFDWTIEESAYY
jgi:hypothetical protein